MSLEKKLSELEQRAARLEDRQTPALEVTRGEDGEELVIWWRRSESGERRIPQVVKRLRGVSMGDI